MPFNLKNESLFFRVDVNGDLLILAGKKEGQDSVFEFFDATLIELDAFKALDLLVVGFNLEQLVPLIVHKLYGNFKSLQKEKENFSQEGSIVLDRMRRFVNARQFLLSAWCPWHVLNQNTIQFNDIILNAKRIAFVRDGESPVWSHPMLELDGLVFKVISLFLGPSFSFTFLYIIRKLGHRRVDVASKRNHNQLTITT